MWSDLEHSEGQINSCHTRHSLIGNHQVKGIWLLLEGGERVETACSGGYPIAKSFKHGLSKLG